MEVNGVNSGATTVVDTNQKAASTTTTAAADSAAKTSKPADDTAAVYEPNKDGKYSVKWDSVDKMLEEANKQAESFRKLVESLFTKQGQTFDQSIRKIASGDFSVDAATAAKAKNDIGEDGYYGVKQTAGRILDFAKAISGGDPAKVEEMRSAIQEGFKAAEKAWGGKMPDITQQTYDAVMKGLDEWAGKSLE